MPPLVAGLAMNILNAVGAGASDAAALMGPLTVFAISVVFVAAYAA